MLSLCKLYGCGAFLVVVSHVVDPGAHGVAPHQPGIEELQQVGHRSHIRHSGVEPQVVAVWIEDHWHPVVHG